MVPDHARRLGVWVVVILVLTRTGCIISPAVQRRTTWRAMEMDGDLQFGAVHNTNDGLRAPRDDECRAWRDPVIAYEARWLQVGVDLLFKRTDLYLII